MHSLATAQRCVHASPRCYRTLNILFLLVTTPLFVSESPAQQVIWISRPGITTPGDFGKKMACVPDIDGDGVDDVVVSAPREWFSPTRQRGAAYVYSGRDGTLRHTLLPFQNVPPVQESFGRYSLFGMNDLNNDGAGDVITSEYVTSSLYIDSGLAGDRIRHLQGAWFSVYSCRVPDVDGDGVNDFAVGHPDWNQARGIVYLFSGMTAEFLRSIERPDLPAHVSQLGGGIAGVDDMDGDGFGDLLIPSAEPLSADPNDRGRTYLYSGNTGQLIRTFDSPVRPAYFFTNGVGIGDVDNDGVADVLIHSSAPTDLSCPPFRRSSGKCFVMSGATGALIRTHQSPYCYSITFGWGLEATDDLDGDGVRDYLIGSPYDAPPDRPPLTGTVYLYSGRTGNLIRTFVSPDPRTDAEQNGTSGFFGYNIATLRDRNPGGRPGIAISAEGDCPVPPCPPGVPGRVYIFWPCRGDYNYDGVLNSQDFFDFLTAYFSQIPAADINTDGTINSQDFFDFLSSFFTGC